MKHIDLFSGIGGFALACKWNDIETVMFCDNNKFCQKILKKHWPNVPIVEDVNDVERIKQIVADTYNKRESQPKGIDEEFRGRTIDRTQNDNLLLTAGFPCQPFSNAGRKRGADDDRYLWPQTFAVIESIKPDWIILENVAGLLGMVFPDSETEMANQTSLFTSGNDLYSSCRIQRYNTIIGEINDNLKQAGYETVWLVIPACSLSAPHRRDRVWIVANTPKPGIDRIHRNDKQEAADDWVRSNSFDRSYQPITPNTSQQGLQGQQPGQPIRLPGQCNRKRRYEKPSWTENWYEVATKFCRVDARVSDRVDRLKSLGNAIVPQVAYEIIKAIKEGNK